MQFIQTVITSEGLKNVSINNRLDFGSNIYSVKTYTHETKLKRA